MPARSQKRVGIKGRMERRQNRCYIYLRCRRSWARYGRLPSTPVHRRNRCFALDQWSLLIETISIYPYDPSPLSASPVRERIDTFQFGTVSYSSSLVFLAFTKIQFFSWLLLTAQHTTLSFSTHRHNLLPVTPISSNELPVCRSRLELINNSCLVLLFRVPCWILGIRWNYLRFPGRWKPLSVQHVEIIRGWWGEKVRGSVCGHCAADRAGLSRMNETMENWTCYTPYTGKDLLLRD